MTRFELTAGYTFKIRDVIFEKTFRLDVSTFLPWITMGGCARLIIFVFKRFICNPAICRALSNCCIAISNLDDMFTYTLCSKRRVYLFSQSFPCVVLVLLFINLLSRRNSDNSGFVEIAFAFSEIESENKEKATAWT